MEAYFALMYQMGAFVKAELHLGVEATASDAPTRSSPSKTFSII